MSMERTLIILKPDAVQRALCGRIISRFEEKGLTIVAMKMIQLTPALAEKHYAAHKGKPFYDGLVRFMTSSPVIVMVLEGKGVVAMVREMMGKTFCAKSPPGTIRGDFGVSNSFNLVHGSDSPESAQQEIALYFHPEECLSWTPATRPWAYDMSKGSPE